MAISKQMNYCSSEGFSYSLKNILDDKTLNCVEVLRTNLLHQKLNIIDNSEIIIYEPDEYSSVVGMFSVSWNENTITLRISFTFRVKRLSLLSMVVIFIFTS